MKGDGTLSENENDVQLTPGDPAVRKKCRRTYALISLALCISYCLAFTASVFFSKYIVELYNNGKIPLPAAQVNAILSFGPMYLICFPLVFLALSRMKKAAPAQQEKTGFKQLLIYYSMCFPIMLAGSTIGNVLSALLSRGESQNHMAQLLSNVDPLVIIITTVFAPIVEELLFRKFIIDRTVQFGEKTAILFSGLSFGLFHMNLYQFFYAFGIGVLLAYIYIRTGKVRYSIFLHVGVNLIGSVLVPFLLRQSDYMEFMKKISSMNIEAALNSPNLVWVIIYMIYSTLYFAVVCYGFVMIITKRKSLTFTIREHELAFREGLFLSVVNVGTIIYFIASILFFTRSLFL